MPLAQLNTGQLKFWVRDSPQRIGYRYRDSLDTRKDRRLTQALAPCHTLRWGPRADANPPSVELKEAADCPVAYVPIDASARIPTPEARTEALRSSHRRDKPRGIVRERSPAHVTNRLSTLLLVRRCHWSLSACLCASELGSTASTRRAKL